MATDFDNFKRCLGIQLNLDVDAIDVAFVQPLNDLVAWWNRQSETTKRYVNWFTTGIGAGALIAFNARLMGTTSGELGTLAAEALGAVMVGIALGLVVAALVDCGIQTV